MSSSPWRARAGSLLCAAAGLFLAICALSYSPADVPLLSSSPQNPPGNFGGALGVWIGFIARGGFGWASLLLSVLCGLWAWRLWRGGMQEIHGVSITIATTSLLASAGTLLAVAGTTDGAKAGLGGLVGFVFARSGSYYLGTVGTVLTALCVAVLSWFVVSGQTIRTMGAGLFRRIASGVWRRSIPVAAGVGSVEAAPRPSPRLLRMKDAKIEEREEEE